VFELAACVRLVQNKSSLKIISPEFAYEEGRPMRTSKKIFIGGLGALTPIIMNLVLIDLENVLLKATNIVVLGYLVRVLTLFYLGGVVAWLHTDEESPVKLFELGIIAPALFMVFINATNHDAPKHANNDSNGAKISEIDNNKPLSIFSSAYAETHIRNKIRPIYYFSNVKDSKVPEEPKSSQFFRGLFGSPGCEGENLKRTKVLVNETNQLVNQIFMGLDFNRIMPKILKITQASLELPSACQQAFQQWMQAFNTQMLAHSEGGSHGGDGARCMSGVCCDSTGCY